ncbi:MULTISPECIES: thiamine pyrophosphate-binding protein [Prochlorococcus]|uniref:thiamine pyrophosphate-binding protein n=1 Tax=Prochlorococcus TaxID=1218 RepID=UPI0005177A51|nr:thiamine pyrophosphate-binding protein [Prochlorococcus marinus]KGF91728.1 Acetolactate synthase large subunit [Prochlorococcus marinus str. MIT 9107]KGF95093.1 Acetolactate synthase large subunit [Prochlorococcus marinus str. MIT 9123]
MRVADFIFDYLKNLGISNVFCLPGGGAMHLNDALYKSGIETTICLHEQAVAISAEYWGRVENNKFGVALVTNGPGATNTLTSVAGAYIESIPMLILSGQVKSTDYQAQKSLRQTGVQEVATLSMAEPITKYQAVITASNQIKSTLDRAIFEMLEGRKGPVWIEVPLDIQGSKYSELEQIQIPKKNKKYSEIENINLEEWAPIISSKRRIVLLAGQGVRLDNAVKELNNFIEENKIISVSTFPGKDCFEYENPLFVGHPGTVAKRSANLAIQNCDLLISIGCSLNNIITAYNQAEFARNADKIIFDIDKNELNKVLPPNSYKIQSTAINAIKDLKIAFKKYGDTYRKNCSEWISFCKDLKERFSFEKDNAFSLNEAANQKGINIYELMDGLSNPLKDFKYIVTGSSGFCIEAFYVLFKNSLEQRILIDSGLGSMGFGLPAAIGVCKATKEKVILIEGDGSLQMNIQELATLKGNNLKLIIIVINNKGYCSIRNTQDGYFKGRRLGSDKKSGLHLPDLSKISSAYKIKHYFCYDLESIKTNIKINENFDGPLILEVFTYPDEKLQPKVSSIPNERGEMVTMPIEDMSPLLDLSELKRWMRYSNLLDRSIDARK